MTLTTPQPAESAAQTTLAAGFRPFPADRAAHYRAAGHWTGRTIDEILRTAAATWPGNIAVADAASAHTFAELDELADRAAAGFAALGIAPGDRVLLQLPNSARFAVALFGLLRAGAVPVMCLPGHRLAELTHFAAVSDAVALVIADSAAGFDYRAMAEELVAARPAVRHVIVDGEPGPFLPWSALESDAEPPVVAPATDTPALLLVSGGTTGAPKLIPRTHDDYVYNFTASARLCALTSDDVYLVVLPAAHNFPLACPGLLGALSVGATTVFTTDPSPEAAFAVIDRHGVTVTALVPALAKLWSAACDWEPLAPKGLRLLQVGGAKLGADDAATVRAALTPGLQQVFGMAEGLLNYTRLGDSPELLDHTQGRPLSELDELRVVDEAGQEVAPGVEGELLVRGPYTINGYFNAPQDNARSFSPDGFYRSGDRVRRFADGYLEVTGRVKDVITRGGETVSALDLEEHLITHPGIWSAAAVPLPDEFLGEKICAVVVFSGAPVSLADLNAYLDSRGVAAHSRPDTLVAMPSLPTTAVGKTDKKAILRQLTR
ncbi:2,3-dihydroxybenzoate-AMP ligase [Mycolicibacterium cosmeticum]|uniref:2,3-dihydroxybenzoate-AMP ligase n=1 Tax=Mycolicibacterium cosmeticum TaxID=258533 RepID=W9AJ33_MYCCO|nr:AMP-binding protein [Mycolicibacterium cosmeticum]TLH72570.1 2,3-dihydroxybenzoate-AMP ligase [Mycolicibacterium cosmeticum]CDO05729.1 2,3-dihydroxybenzoate-AMP ligase [Mycolicibacterium cosmeticum]